MATCSNMSVQWFLFIVVLMSNRHLMRTMSHLNSFLALFPDIHEAAVALVSIGGMSVGIIQGLVKIHGEITTPSAKQREDKKYASYEVFAVSRRNKERETSLIFHAWALSTSKVHAVSNAYLEGNFLFLELVPSRGQNWGYHVCQISAGGFRAIADPEWFPRFPASCGWEILNCELTVKVFLVLQERLEIEHKLVGVRAPQWNVTKKSQHEEEITFALVAHIVTFKRSDTDGGKWREFLPQASADRSYYDKWWSHLLVMYLHHQNKLWRLQSRRKIGIHMCFVLQTSKITRKHFALEQKFLFVSNTMSSFRAAQQLTASHPKLTPDFCGAHLFMLFSFFFRVKFRNFWSHDPQAHKNMKLYSPNDDPLTSVRADNKVQSHPDPRWKSWFWCCCFFVCFNEK